MTINTPSFLVLDNVSDSYDVILGDPWFVQHDAVLAWKHGWSCTVTKGQQRILLEAISCILPSPGLAQPPLVKGEAVLDDTLAVKVPLFPRAKKRSVLFEKPVDKTLIDLDYGELNCDLENDLLGNLPYIPHVVMDRPKHAPRKAQRKAVLAHRFVRDAHVGHELMTALQCARASKKAQKCFLVMVTEKKTEVVIDPRSEQLSPALE